MNFRSDNTASAAAEIMAALTSVNDGPAVGYGEDPWSRKLDEALGALFEREVRVFTVASGTAANSIALASVTPPWGSIICHREAHIECDECGAPEFFSGGAKLVLVDGEAANFVGQVTACFVVHAARLRTQLNGLRDLVPIARHHIELVYVRFDGDFAGASMVSGGLNELVDVLGLLL